MNQRDKTILVKIVDYCQEIRDTHDYFKHDKEFFSREGNHHLTKRGCRSII